jgi:lysophospholipase L1-like esterase
MTAENLTNHTVAARRLVKTYNLTTDPIVNNTGQFTVYAQGGTYQILGWQCINNEVQNPSTLLVGDSKIMGFDASSFDNTIPAIIGKKYNNVAVSAGFGDKTSDILNHLPEIIAMKPKVVVFAAGSNDVRFGVSASTTMANVASIKSAFEATGAKFIILSPIYEGATDLSGQYADFNTAYGGDPNYIDVYYESRKYGLAGDNIHDSDDTYNAIAQKIIDANILTDAKSDY